LLRSPTIQTNIQGEPPFSSLLAGRIGEKTKLPFENIGKKPVEKIYKTSI